MSDAPAQPTPNSSFSKITPKLQLAWDSTSYNAFQKCPRYYQHVIIEGRVSPGLNPHLRFGILFHSATELYDKTRAGGSDHETALITALRYILLETWDSDNGHPWLSNEPTKTRKTLLRTLVWYLDTFENDSLRTLILANGLPAVELSFRFDPDISTSDGAEDFLLCGHLDRLVEWNDEIYITDKKTTKYMLDDQYFKQFNPDNQISLYTLAGFVTLHKNVAGLIIDGCQILVNGSRFRRQEIPTSPELVDEWRTDLQFYLLQAELYARDEYWPLNRRACGYGHNQCTFRPVCSSDPAIRPMLLDSMFETRRWDPLRPR